MKILALETSGPVCTVALAGWTSPPRDATRALKLMTLVRRTGHSEFARHAEILFGLIDEVLGPRRLEGVTGIAVSIGPGSFTGLRVGLAAAKTFARFGRIPLAGVSTLEAMAASAPDDARSIVATLDALRGEVYAATFRRAAGRLRLAAGPWILDPAGLERRMPAGAVRITGQPDAGVIAALGAVRLAAGRSDDPDRLVPAYLREPEAVLKRRLRVPPPAGRRTVLGR